MVGEYGLKIEVVGVGVRNCGVGNMMFWLKREVVVLM